MSSALLRFAGRDLTRAGSFVAGALGLLVAAVRERRLLERQGLWRQAYIVANGSIPFIVVVMSFIGAIMVIQASVQAQRIIGDLSAIGPGFLQLLVREFAPTLVALMVAARYGAGIAAELASLTVTEQVFALRLSGAEPGGYLVLPRTLAGLLAAVPLTVLGAACAFGAGYLAARQGFGVRFDTYFRLGYTAYSDVLVGGVKALAFGAVVPLVASHAGLSARGGAPGVGRATTIAVIGASIAVLALDLLIGALAHGLEAAP